MALLKQTGEDNIILEKVLELDIPAYRDAYSDRTAWLMACFSELAYIKFNKADLSSSKTRKAFSEAISIIIEDNSKIAVVNQLVDSFVYDHKKETKKLNTNLGLLNYGLDSVYDADGSQALLARNDQQKRLILAFRGTEPKVVRDIKTDIDAKLQSNIGGGKSHRGFSKAYWAIGYDIQARLSQDDVSDYRIYITGHSLGGALATIATKHLKHKGGISACYTFGAPRVGNKDWVADIKPPMYRVVNSSDIVPMLPPNGDLLNSIGYIVSHLIPVVGKPLAKVIRRYTGYFHSGDMRFLTKPKKGNLFNAGLLPHTSSLSRILLWIRAKMPSQGVQDHSISLYRKKLGAIAVNRNQV